MAYINFTLSKVKNDFAIDTDETQDIFIDITPIKPSDLLMLTLKEPTLLAQIGSFSSSMDRLLISIPMITISKKLTRF
jgi:hypothetical protein